MESCGTAESHQRRVHQDRGLGRRCLRYAGSGRKQFPHPRALGPERNLDRHPPLDDLEPIEHRSPVRAGSVSQDRCGARANLVDRRRAGPPDVVRLNGWGLRPWMEFELDPLDGRYTKRRLTSEPTQLNGYAGFGQELSVAGLGITLCSVFAYQQDIVFRMGGSAWNLHQPGLEIAHREGFWHCELTINDPGGTPTTFRYRRKDILLVIIDTTYDHLDF